MNEAELRRLYPNASESFFAKNAHDYRPRLRAVQPQPDERLPLAPSPAREEAGWHDAARRFEIVFTVYSRRPCDWDGYDIKALQDFLIKAGILPDDGWQTLAGRVVSRKAATEEEERTEITITTI